MQQDVRGLDLTTPSPEAAKLYDEIVDDYFHYEMTVPKKLKALLEMDPQFGMAHCLRGYVLMMLMTNAILPKVHEAVAAARGFLKDGTRREQLHVDALEAWANGDVLAACACWDEILNAHPRDLLALRLHHNGTFWTGRNYVLRNTVASVFDAWNEDVPGYAHVLGMFAFGLEECGDYQRAEALGRQAVEIDPEDLWAIHAVAHVLEMQGRHDDGARWLDRPADAWAGKNPFQGHVWWHAALFALEKGDIDKVLGLYDNQVRAANTEFYLDVQNMASMLKRLEMLGLDVGDRWTELADYAENHLDDHMMAFTDIHACLSLAAAGRGDAAQRFVASLRDFGKTPGNFAAGTMAGITVPLCEGIIASEAGDYARAVDIMMPIRNDLAPVGGSHAQRDLFHQMLLNAAFRSGRLELARSMLSERISIRSTCKSDWVKYEQVLSELGDAAGAARAEQCAAAIH
jgi:tetratricopeptide (TPR) repeat protein